MSSIRIQNLTKTYYPHKTTALRGVELQLPSKQFLAVVGPSGCGKSTLLRCIAGLEKSDGGSIFFDEEDISGTPAHKREAVMVFQSILLFPHLSIFENVAFGLRVRKYSQEKIQQRVGEILERVQLSHLAQKRPHHISGGEQQRIALARALVVHPKILLLDEPLANLDRHLWRDMTYLIRDLHNYHQTTTILVTHNQEEALLLSDRIAVMFSGQVIQTGHDTDLYHQPKTLDIARFFDARNIHPATKKKNSVVSECGTLQIAPDNPYSACPDGEVTIVVRPEDIAHRSNGNGTDNDLHGCVLSSRFTSSQWRTRVQVGKTIWETLGPLRYQNNDNVTLHIPPDALMIFPAHSPPKQQG